MSGLTRATSEPPVARIVSTLEPFLNATLALRSKWAMGAIALYRWVMFQQPQITRCKRILRGVGGSLSVPCSEGRESCRGYINMQANISASRFLPQTRKTVDQEGLAAVKSKGKSWLGWQKRKLCDFSSVCCSIPILRMQLGSVVKERLLRLHRSERRSRHLLPLRPGAERFGGLSRCTSQA